MTKPEPELSVRTATSDDWPAIRQLTRLTFHEALDAEQGEVERGVFEPDRSLVVRAPSWPGCTNRCATPGPADGWRRAPAGVEIF